MYNSYDDYHPLSYMPEHVGIVPDGGRRWAKEHNCTYYESYIKSVDLLYDFARNLYNDQTKYISIYFSSTQNFRRSKSEVNAFCKGIEYFLREYAGKLYYEYNVNIIVAGRKEGLPKRLINEIDKLPKVVSSKEKKMYICINYNPHYEIEKAVLVADKKSDIYVNHLQIKEPLNIMIRTGDANTLSNFLLPQIGFARLFFLEKLFNDCTLTDIENIIKKYSEFDLKYGN